MVSEKMGITDGKLADGVTYVPLWAVGEVLGVNVGWDNKTKTKARALMEYKILLAY
ncbi:stalk domain-containing protein [Paenibacillus sp. NPDC093718]|uniref:stalk domain-containing protein n=1 Tax=Paenibacillus sp. NPDC093718 TaxID=3390601 RepID=UPI003CFEEF29